MGKHTAGPLSYDGFGWGKLSDGSIFIEAEHAELAERRLIAAPELLEACKWALMEWTLHAALTDSAKALRAAIAAADGRE